MNNLKLKDMFVSPVMIADCNHIDNDKNKPIYLINAKCYPTKEYLATFDHDLDYDTVIDLINKLDNDPIVKQCFKPFNEVLKTSDIVNLISQYNKQKDKEDTFTENDVFHRKASIELPFYFKEDCQIFTNDSEAIEIVTDVFF